MDVLTIVCAIVQFVDCGVKVIASARELCQSPTGTTARHAELQNKSERLASITTTISGYGSLQNFKVEAGLRKIVDECNDVDVQLRLLLADLKLDPSAPQMPGRKLVDRVFKSVVKTSKSFMKASAITELAEKMTGLREEVHTYILYMLREQVSTTHQELVQLIHQNESMGIGLSDEIRKAKDQIIHQIQSSSSTGSPAADSDALEPLMRDLPRRAIDVKAKTAILLSLHFVEIQNRHDQIKSAADNTLKWLSNPSSTQSAEKTVHFTEWVQSQKPDDNIFWISGKPGSGESTLMKYLWENDTVANCLSEWARPKKITKCRFSFWKAGGSDMLKSQLGFLRALAFEILKSNPAAIPDACPRQYARHSSGNHFPDPWNIEELLGVIERAVFWKENNTKFCFFIDGLDEYSGEPEEIISLFRKLPVSPDVKYCLSSRKWNMFRNEFGEDTRDSSRCLYVEELNATDIMTFISQTLEKEPVFKRYMAENKQDSQHLVRTVTNNSDGVFLWVDLVVRSLIRGIHNLDPLETLQDRVNNMPRDLDAYFERMLDDVEDVYRRDAAKIYHIMLQTTTQPYLVMFAFLWEKYPCFGAVAKIEPASEAEAKHLKHTLRMRINARCTVLLDIIQTPREDDFFQLRIDFLHRTVREYLEMRKTKTRLEQWLNKDDGEKFDPHQYICQSIVAQIRRGPIRYNWTNR